VWESNPQEFSGSDGFQDRLALPVPNLPPAKLAGATRLERAWPKTGRGFGVRCIASYATPLRLVHAAGLEPAVSLVGDPDLQSGAFAAQATHAKSVIVKNDEGRE
jgi:hypothetical protein